MAKPQLSPTLQKPEPRENAACGDWIPIGAIASALVAKLTGKRGAHE